MEKLTKVIILIVSVSFIIGGIFGFEVSKTYFPTIKTISDRKSNCEKLGGKYRFFWGDLSNEYIEDCEILSKTIDNF